MNLINTNISFEYMKERCATIEDLIKLRSLAERLNDGKDISVIIKIPKLKNAEEIVEEVLKENRKIIIK